MEKVCFDYSMKDIPIPPLKAYKINLLDKIESVLKRMRWKALFYLNPSDESRAGKFNLKSRKCPPPIYELKPFEDDMFKLVENLKFQKVINSFEDKLKCDVKKVNSSDKVLVFSEKSRNVYELDKTQYEKLLRENITKSYRKADKQFVNSVNQELNNIATKLDIGDRIKSTARQQAFISLKDHKENFQNNPKCRPLNPAKNNLGLISKQILDRINGCIRSQTNVNQWRNTHYIIDWFSAIQNKSQCTFLIFDIVDFYPSISEALLRLSLDYTKQFTTVSDEDEEIILHSRKILLFNDNEPWVKAGDPTMFDAAMGSYGSTEVCELVQVGLYILHKLTTAFPSGNIGLYRDDGMAAFRNTSARSLDKARKIFSQILRELGLKVTAHSNLKIVNYLDVK